VVSGPGRPRGGAITGPPSWGGVRAGGGWGGGGGGGGPPPPVLREAGGWLHPAVPPLPGGGAVAADGLLHAGRCVLNALDACASARHHHDAASLTDGERGAGVDADERFLDRDGVRRVLRDEIVDVFVNRPQSKLWTTPRGGFP